MIANNIEELIGNTPLVRINTLSEETDSHILVVSEETGTLSYVHNGIMKRGLDEIQLRRVLNNVII